MAARVRVHVIMAHWRIPWLLVFINSPVLFSIHFDEYYDVDEVPMDGLDANQFPCFQIKSRCDLTDECCGPATCALPAWSPYPVCLVPGYKEDDKLERMSARQPPRREDILYIRNTYNTTFYDFLLSDFTPSPLETQGVDADASGVSSTARVTTVAIDDGSYRFENGSEDHLSNKTEFQQKINMSSWEDDDGNYTQSSYDSKSEDVSESHKVPTFNSTNPDILEDKKSRLSFKMNQTLQELKLSLLHHQSFLLVNSTIKGDPRANLSAIYDSLKSSDQFKVVVKLLQEKLKQLNEKERKLVAIKDPNVEVQKTTEITTSTVKYSKWDVVKKFFLHKDSEANLKNVDEEDSLKITTEIINTKFNEAKENVVLIDQGNNKLSKKTESTESVREILKKFIPSSEIDAFLEDEGSLVNTNNLKEENNEGILEFYNINIPYDSVEKGEQTLEREKKFLHNSFRTTADTIISSLKSNDVNEIGATLYKSSLTTTHDDNMETTTQSVRKPPKKVHLWQEAYLWPVHTNVSETLARKLKNLFVWKIKSNYSEKHHKKPMHLNEHFLLMLNSRNMSDGNSNTLSNNEQDEKTPPDYLSGYSSSVESGSSASEDLYNNSYVFVVHKEDSIDPKQQTKFGRILNFFHIRRITPDSKNKSLCDGSSSKACSQTNENLDETLQKLTEIVSKNMSEPVETIVRLPENLMPEALQDRQLNDTDFLFLEDSNEAEDKTVEKHKSSNSTFFFFFK